MLVKEVMLFWNKYKKYIIYIFVGGCTTLVNLLVYTYARYIGIDLMFSNTIAFIISVIFAYITNKIYVFKTETHNSLYILLKEFIKFAGMRVGSFVVETILLFIMVKIFPYETILKLVIGVIVVILNYIISNKFVFKN